QLFAGPSWRPHQCDIERLWLELEKAVARVRRKPSPLFDYLTFSGTTRINEPGVEQTEPSS
ncbi:MAG TPA: hypothetical protein VE262_19025, partial [Blastocatellia bacterium]|nr:hypothetical protein [Blastocatellia bacterium]